MGLQSISLTSGPAIVRGLFFAICSNDGPTPRDHRGVCRRGLHAHRVLLPAMPSHSTAAHRVGSPGSRWGSRSLNSRRDFAALSAGARFSRSSRGGRQMCSARRYGTKSDIIVRRRVRSRPSEERPSNDHSYIGAGIFRRFVEHSSFTASERHQ